MVSLTFIPLEAGLDLSSPESADAYVFLTLSLPLECCPLALGSLGQGLTPSKTLDALYGLTELSCP